MKSGKEIYDKQVLDILEKKYHLFLDSPKGEIQMYLVLPPKKDFDDINKGMKKEIEYEKDIGFSSKNILNMDSSFSNIMDKNFTFSNNNIDKVKFESNKLRRLSNNTNFLNRDD